MVKKNSPTIAAQTRNPANGAWVPVVIGLASVFFLKSSIAVQLMGYEICYYLLLPLLWMDLTLYALWGWFTSLKIKPQITTLLVGLAVSAGLLQIIGILVSGWLWGAGFSPYRNHISVVLGIFLRLVIGVIGLEMTRAYLLARANKSTAFSVFIAIVVLFTLFAIPPGVFRQLKEGTRILSIVGETILPAISESMLLTYMAWIGGPWMAIIYRIFPLTYEWLSPILPDMTWMQTAFMKTLLPLGILAFINAIIAGTEKQETRNNDSSYSWYFIALLSAGMIWLNVGLFGIRTFLISGVSMEPTLEAGDIVIVRPSNEAKDIQIGDIILFNDYSKLVMHRVVEIKHTEELEFITRGDANHVPDRPVTFRQIEGKAIFRIPKIGWLSLNLKRLIARLA